MQAAGSRAVSVGRIVGPQHARRAGPAIQALGFWERSRYDGMGNQFCPYFWQPFASVRPRTHCTHTSIIPRARRSHAKARGW